MENGEENKINGKDAVVIPPPPPFSARPILRGKSIATREKTPPEEASFFSRINIVIGGGIDLPDKVAFARNLATMEKAGLPLSRALGVLGKQSKKPAMKKVVRALGEAITRGEPLHSALAAFPRVFSSLFVAMVKAGEESGKLHEALFTISEHLKGSYELQKRVGTALIYPAIIVIAIIIVAVIMLLYVVPVLSETFEELGVELPLSTRSIIAVSAFLHDSLSLALAIFAGILLFIAVVAATRGGKKFFDWLILHTPLISSLTSEVNTARTARTLSSLLSAGIPIQEALAVTKDVVQNSFYIAALKEAHDEVGKGAALSAVFSRHEKIYPLLFSEMIAVGEETGRLSDMLLQTAAFYEDEVLRKTRDLSSVIEPFLMVVMGVAVGFFAFSMIMPMYSLVGSI
ncbi:MAG: type II secretion system F family protein [Parcubacteria group bacterium]|nr:type II secretion system F family protein [Parcubacteria group bacterium]